MLKQDYMDNPNPLTATFTHRFLEPETHMEKAESEDSGMETVLEEVVSFPASGGTNVRTVCLTLAAFTLSDGLFLLHQMFVP